MGYCTNIGIDAHSKKNSVCALIASTGEVRSTTLSEDPSELIRWIFSQSFPEPLGCVYESGPTGFGLARALREAGVACTVAATSKLPVRLDRQKNDRIDAEWLARMLAAGSVRPVRVPRIEEEALCHLSRLRGEIAADLRAAKQRVASFLLLTGTEYTRGGAAKTGNSPIRRILIESASRNAHPFKVAKIEDGNGPELVRAKARKCASRLRRRRVALVGRGANGNKAKVAIARELAEWICRIAVMEAWTEHSPQERSCRKQPALAESDRRWRRGDPRSLLCTAGRRPRTQEESAHSVDGVRLRPAEGI